MIFIFFLFVLIVISVIVLTCYAAYTIFIQYPTHVPCNQCDQLLPSSLFGNIRNRVWDIECPHCKAKLDWIDYKIV